MGLTEIQIRGAREHNLKNLDINIPHNKFVVVTGISGSGKSSLAFDTIYAEGQRRYVESLSAYARQFLEQMEKPDVERIDGLTPTIAIEQRSGSANPRSTVATTTEIYDYMRLLYARTGEPHCPKCGREISRQSATEIVDRLMDLPDGSSLAILAPLVRGRKGEHRDAIARVKREGFIRVRVDGQILEAKDVGALAKNRKHKIEAVVDRLLLKRAIRPRVADSVELALRMGEGIMIASIERGAERSEALYSELYACPVCGLSMEEMEPRVFSFNSPYGACPACDGLGTKLELDPELIVPDPALSLERGAIAPWRGGGRRMNIFYNRALRNFAERHGVAMDTPYNKIDEETRRVLVFGTEGAPRLRRRSHGPDRAFEGVIPNLARRFATTESEFVKQRIHEFMSVLPCPECKGARLKPEALAVTVGGKPINRVSAMTVSGALEFFDALKLQREKAKIGRQVLKEIRARLEFLRDVGLPYLTLDRTSATLAGGEAQRIRLASQLGSRLVGVTYVLDEPTIGLHQRDNARLISTLLALRDIGNTVLVVEHDEEVIRSADHIIDLGPGAGLAGGEVVAAGTIGEIIASKSSLTGKYLSRELRIPVPARRRRPRTHGKLTIVGARENNLKDIDVTIPLGVFTCVTGVSGSGKSSLVTEILYKALARAIHRARAKPGAHKRIDGAGHVDKVIEIDQSPIGKTPRSNPATYTGIFDEIRNLFAKVQEARVRGYKAGRFSFNVKGGRCEPCQGQGTIKIEMHFLPDVYVHCQSCKGRRYNPETLEVLYKGKSIADVLDMTVDEARLFFRNFPRVKRLLGTLYDVGLGYIRLGQSSTTLSGGEAQRIKLAAELGKSSTGDTLYVLDEPTTGLHFADIHKLLEVLNRLVEMGNSAVVIEHNMDVIKTADWIIDLGPEGGEAGGRVVATGTPEEVSRIQASYTGQYLRKVLENP